ncbi:alpha/beta fold hydrolase [Novosphingobium sp. P6W]|uniref:alpha/beta fold hydrolase n=1 Tax=Novosphingobium sp. P6W TaxID=1609758 RepID=UPI0005C301AA|nr:alpha/beta hydrolase [Novosphingobium sp. P6W]AXB79454.1 alpha/beta hydrolase [Novosphingobium sp. P6W]KIS34216.1 alpha/beta hydrolase [Novosphingobium sp. P6W]
MDTQVCIRRGFADLAQRQVHYRSAGEKGQPLLILHASPGSSRQQVRLIEDFAGEAMVFAPDTPGNGDSEALGAEEPEIAALAGAMLEYLDVMGLEQVRVYGSHTGAAIAAELAILAPGRVSHLVLDGVSLMEGAELEEILATYAFPFEPDLDGAYLARLFQFCRDQYLFFPWYRRTREGRRDGGLGSPDDLHAWVTEVMKASTTYHLNYRAAFKWPADRRLPLIQCPVLVTAAVNDPLYEASAGLAPLLPNGRFLELPRFDDPGFRTLRHDAMATFFAGNN